MGTGLRQGEQWCLHLEDGHVAGETPHLVVRYGSYDRVRGRYRSPKGRAGEKHSRVVPLFGLGLEAAKAWLRMLPGYAPENPHGLMFPTPTGARREGRLRRWPLIAKAFGVVKPIGRKPWWHLLRHTCASSLTSGWWGRAWRLEEVRDMLGHSVITTTERYAHLASDALQAVATLAKDAWASRHAAVTPSGRRARKRSAAAKEPVALARCAEALGLALGVLLEDAEAVRREAAPEGDACAPREQREARRAGRRRRRQGVKGREVDAPASDSRGTWPRR